MLHYLRKLLSGSDSVIVTVQTRQQLFARAGIYGVDEIGIAIQDAGGDFLLPWTAIVSIQRED